LRLRLREALRPLELALLSLGARVSESLSTRLDSVRAPDLLCVDEARPDPDDLLRELEPERLFDEDEERLFAFGEEFDLDEVRLEPPERLLLLDLDAERLEPPVRLLLLDRVLPWGILPWLLLDRSFRPCSALTRIPPLKHAGIPPPRRATRTAVSNSPLSG
jgi:hypothetical protein